MVLIERFDSVHIDEVHKIEKESFTEGVWTKKAFMECLSHSQVLSYVIKYENKVIGYIIVKMIKSECKILNLAINREFRKMGYGSMLLDFIIKKLKDEEYRHVSLEVRKSNIAAQNLYKKAGFQFLSLLEKYYQNREDAFILGLNIRRISK